TMTCEEQQRNLSLLGKLNHLAGIDYPDDSFLRARIKSYELAFQMQTAVPDTVDLEKEREETQQLYGLDKTETKAFGWQCHAARRTPRPQARNRTIGTGRDQHPHGCCAWLAGAGVKAGVVHGATDELGFHAVENPHYVTDLHATVMHLMGLDSRKLEVPGFKR